MAAVLHKLEESQSGTLFFLTWVPELGPVVISYVFPQLLPPGVAPEPAASSQQCASVTAPGCAPWGAVTTDSPLAMGAAGGLPVGWGRGTPKTSL